MGVRCAVECAVGGGVGLEPVPRRVKEAKTMARGWLASAAASTHSGGKERAGEERGHARGVTGMRAALAVPAAGAGGPLWPCLLFGAVRVAGSGWQGGRQHSAGPKGALARGAGTGRQSNGYGRA